jgi:MFS family permease
LAQVIVGWANVSSVTNTIVGELTDSSNQADAFAALPIFYALGGAIGPLLGGLLASPIKSIPNEDAPDIGLP